jgi:two-component system OmpR family sensor kinase
VTRGLLGRPRLLRRVYLYGVLMMALAGGASFLVGSYVITPAVEVPARPSTAWIAWHLLELTGEPERLAHELVDLKRRTRVEMTLFDVAGRVLASNASERPEPLDSAALASLERNVTQFSSGAGAVAKLDQRGKVERYARVTYPVPELPLGSALAQLAAALAVLAVLSIPLARSITAPLEKLAKLARVFGDGDLSARSEVKGGDEIGDLARAFDEMADRVVNLRRSEKELLANVSHELRTPLARIRMALDLVQGGDSETAASYVADIEEDLEELERLLDDVMTAARLDISRGVSGDGLPPLRRRVLAGRELLEASEARFARRFQDRTLTCRIADNLPSVNADPSLLRRVLDNLLDNAVKFSDDGSAIELSAAASSDGAELVIEVSDHGIGIAPADLNRIFEPFFRADRSRTRATGGVGLGLALARRIVEAHDGTISAESELAAGTRFRVAVPAISSPLHSG